VDVVTGDALGLGEGGGGAHHLTHGLLGDAELECSLAAQGCRWHRGDAPSSRRASLPLAGRGHTGSALPLCCKEAGAAGGGPGAGRTRGPWVAAGAAQEWAGQAAAAGRRSRGSGLEVIWEGEIDAAQGGGGHAVRSTQHQRKEMDGSELQAATDEGGCIGGGRVDGGPTWRS
jgi:hypothetical protein